MSIVYLIFVLLFQSTPPALTARWDSADSATIQWTQTTRSCLYRESAIGERVFIECVERAGTIVLTLGGAETDGNFRPTAGDVFVLTDGRGAVLAPAPLVGRPVYLPVWR